MLRVVIPLALIASGGCGRTHESPLARAAAYLWRQQAPDGGWHSQTYGLLRSGQLLTPFVLDALPEAVYPVLLQRRLELIC